MKVLEFVLNVDHYPEKMEINKNEKSIQTINWMAKLESTHFGGICNFVIIKGFKIKAE